MLQPGIEAEIFFLITGVSVNGHVVSNPRAVRIHTAGTACSLKRVGRYFAANKISNVVGRAWTTGELALHDENYESQPLVYFPGKPKVSRNE